MSVKKFRPSLTQAQIHCIIESLGKVDQTPMVQSTYRALRMFAYKLDNGIVSAGYETVHKSPESIEDALGLLSHSVDPYEGLSRNEKRTKAYNKWRDNPLSCSQDEIDLAMTHGYDNGLLSESEFIPFVMNNLGMTESEAKNAFDNI